MTSNDRGSKGHELNHQEPRLGEVSVGSNSTEKIELWLFAVYIGDDKLPSFIGIIISHCKDPYEPIIKVECHWWVLKVAQLEFSRLAPISTGVKNYALSLLPAED